MRKQKKRLLSLTLSLAMAVTLISVPKITSRAEDSGVGGFVNRCYQVTLGREADPEGYADWTSQLTEGRSDGATVAYGFVFSPEYTNANKDNGAFVTDMYTLFLGRTPDEAGYNDWKGKLDAGADRMDIFYGFANSPEFFNICTDYGVTAGYFTTEFNKDQVNAVNMFVARMYRICLGRLGDQGGQADWTEKLLRGELTGNQCAFGFIFSQEYTNLGLSNEDYVKNLYRTFMGREYDQGGFDDWTSKLNAGFTRDEVFSGFANSSEFQNICDSYGIIRGDYAASDVHEEAGSNDGGDGEQEHGWRVTKKSYSNGQYSVYSYDDGDSYPNKVVRYRADGSEIGFEQMQEYGDNAGRYAFADYDNDGNCTYYFSTVYERTDETEQGYTEKGTHYDRDNNVVGYHESKFVYFENFAGAVEYRDYNANHELEYYDKTQRSSDGNEIKEEYYRADDTLWYTREYEYDANGNKIAQTYTYYGSDGVMVSSVEKTTYEYAGPNGQISKSVTYDRNGKASGFCSYIYENGKLVREESHFGDNDRLGSKTEYEYDANGNEAKSTVTLYYFAAEDSSEVVDTNVSWTATEYEWY